MSQLDLALQGNLFGEPELAASGSGSNGASHGSKGDASAAAESELNDAALTADAAARPRQRSDDRGEATNTTATPGSSERDGHDDHAEQTSAADQNGGTEAEDDLPAWSHHSLVNPSQLTPMLRHYVELKAAHPDRVLLYRLGDFFECFFEDAIELSRLLELTLTGKEGGKAIGP